MSEVTKLEATENLEAIEKSLVLICETNPELAVLIKSFLDQFILISEAVISLREADVNGIDVEFVRRLNDLYVLIDPSVDLSAVIDHIEKMNSQFGPKKSQLILPNQ